MSDHELRELKFRLKQANKVVGVTGERIHLLRAELAEVRLLNSKIDRGDLRRLERQSVEWAEERARLIEEGVNAHRRIAELEEKLADNDPERDWAVLGVRNNA
jgi:hypothetical protein